MRRALEAASSGSVLVVDSAFRASVRQGACKHQALASGMCRRMSSVSAGLRTIDATPSSRSSCSMSSCLRPGGPHIDPNRIGGLFFGVLTLRDAPATQHEASCPAAASMGRPSFTIVTSLRRNIQLTARLGRHPTRIELAAPYRTGGA
jgi:hypothetical protein